jgi:hypothetical protein|tara:strand:+ start:168 stop:821 length:654 start_codon:yes stop_codon:yes gene_type:complete
MRFFIVLISFCTSLTLYGQIDSSNTPSVLFNDYSPLSTSYYGNLLFQPGIKLALDRNLLKIEKSKVKKRKTKYTQKLLYFQPNLTFYVHPKTLAVLQLNTELGWRRYNSRLLFSEVALSIGYSRRFNQGETYFADPAGNITDSKKGTSRGYFATGISLGCGAVIFIQEKPITLYSKLNANILKAYNAGLLTEGILEFGIRFQPNFGLRNTTVKTIIK